jgi:hypothetical protein
MNPDDFKKSVNLAEKAGYKKMKHKSAHFGIVCKNNKGKIWIHEIKWLRDRFRKKNNFIQELKKIGLELTEIREILLKKKKFLTNY